MTAPNWLNGWKQAARRLKTQTTALFFALGDPRVPWYAKAVAAAVVAYAFSPIDLIPDFIPVLGYLDDLILVPLGIALAVRLVPPEVLAECARRAEGQTGAARARFRFMGVVIGLVWALGLAWLGFRLWRGFARP